MKVFAVEGNTQKLDGGAMYGNAPRELWKRWSPPDETNRITLACRSLLLQTDDGRNILFEAGVGAFFEDSMKKRYGIEQGNHVLLESLASSGVKDPDIDAVALSHLHFDHIGGLVSAYGDGEMKLLFPKARFYVSRRQWERANNPHTRDKASYILEIIKLIESSGRLVLVGDDGKSDLSPVVSFSFSDGHTPGLMISHIEFNGRKLVFVSDLIPAAPWVNAAITMGYDRFPELLIEEKNTLLTQVCDQNGILFFTHDPQISFAKISRDPKGRWSADPAQL